MYRNHRIVVIAPCLNEYDKIWSVVRRVRALGYIDEIVVVDNGSSDGGAAYLGQLGATVIRAGEVQGVGYAIRTGMNYAATRSDIIVVIAGNNKDEPEEIQSLLDPIIDGRAEFVQGSRYLSGGSCGGDMPFYRKVATRLHPLLFSLIVRRRVTDSTNGFRAFATRLLADSRIHLEQLWLNQYELEPYLLYKVITLGLGFQEVPVTKIYPSRKVGYTKMKPIIGWWSILRPLFLLGLGFRR